MTTPAITADLSQPGTQAPAPVPAGPHARLLQMIQGLSVGVGALAHSATTGGREGGPEEVQAYQAEQQKEQLRAQESQQSAQRAQREQQESDLRISSMRANQQIQAFQFEQARMHAPLDYQLKTNEVQEQKLNLLEHMAKEYNLPPAMVLQYMPGDSTQQTIDGVADMAKTSGTDLHNLYSVHTQTDGKPGAGGKVAAYDLAGKFGNTPIKPEDGAQLAANLSRQLDTNAAMIPGGENDPSIKNARALLDQIIKPGFSNGGITFGTWAALEYKALTPSNVAVTQQGKVLLRQKEEADTKRAQQEADPAFQVSQAGKKKGAEVAAEVPFAGQKAAAEASARQPYEVALKNLEAPIAAGVQNDEQAKKEAEKYTHDYVEKMGDISDLKSAVGQASSGNVAAARIALIKLTGISMPSGSKRLSPEAMYQLEHMGSDAQKFIGSIKNALTGDNWTAGMTQDVLDFANQQAMKARTRLSMGVHTLNAVRGTKLDPDTIVRSANQDQDWAQQSDSPDAGPTSSTAAPGAPSGSGLASKWGAKRVPKNQ